MYGDILPLDPIGLLVDSMEDVRRLRNQPNVDFQGDDSLDAL